MCPHHRVSFYSPSGFQSAFNYPPSFSLTVTLPAFLSFEGCTPCAPSSNSQPQALTPPPPTLTLPPPPTATHHPCHSPNTPPHPISQFLLQAHFLVKDTKTGSDCLPSHPHPSSPQTHLTLGLGFSAS